MKKDDDQPTGFEFHDIWVAASLLTRLPVPVDHSTAGERGAAAVWAYPIVGGALGLIAGLLATFIGVFGFSSGVVAVIAIALLAIMSGVMHEDGLSDATDGLIGATTAEKALTIMKDSRIGSFGALALVLVVLGKWTSLGDIGQSQNIIVPLVVAGALSRVPMIAAMVYMDHARDDGLSAGVGRPTTKSLGVAAAIAVGTAFVLTGFFSTIFFVFCVAVAALPVYAIAQRKIGGQTGDILGASQQCAEFACLAAIAALI